MDCVLNVVGFSSLHNDSLHRDRHDPRNIHLTPPHRRLSQVIISEALHNSRALNVLSAALFV